MRDFVRSFILTIAGVGISAIGAGGAWVASYQPDAGSKAAVAALTVFFVTLGIVFLADYFFGEGRREGKAETEAHFNARWFR